MMLYYLYEHALDALRAETRAHDAQRASPGELKRGSVYGSVCSSPASRAARPPRAAPRPAARRPGPRPAPGPARAPATEMTQMRENAKGKAPDLGARCAEVIRVVSPIDKQRYDTVGSKSAGPPLS